MPLPVAHSLIGASVAAALNKKTEGWWKLLCVSAFLGVCPDFDYILNWLRVGKGGWHHGFTHSIVFALVIGAAMSLVTRWRTVQAFIVFSAATASHTLLDYLMTESRGVSMWWPFTDHRYKLQGPNPIDYTWSTTSLAEAAVDIIRISLTELLIFGPILLVVIVLRSLSFRKGKTPHGMDH
ncbi:MAG TPA: metal-dependent hydrolase [Pyrinomonadaceae bacterium]|nr:metal-dependent hydrolase [Pyrinomonadaceae bacterium]